jgi:hypothetical protein
MANPKKRVIDFTEETLAALPKSEHTSVVYYDRSRQYWCARKTAASGQPTFMVKTTKAIREAALRRGQRLGTKVNLGTIPLDEARELAIKTWEELNGYRTSSPIPEYRKGVVPEAILDDRETIENPNYDLLQSVLMDAYEQAASGKGADRHGFGLNFEDQDMIEVTNRVGLGFPLGQAIKKLSEGKRLDRAKAKKEFLGAIVYIAGAIIWMDKQE